jgi:hypothetical protein
VNIITRCRDCNGPLPLTDLDDRTTVHPDCTPKPTRAEQLCEQWLAAVLTDNTALEHELHSKILELDSRPPRMLAAALQYATWGWAVFPCRTHTKRPSTRNGLDAATTNPDRIKAWWTKHPNHNIAIPTGTHFDVIDVDLPDAAHAHIALLKADDTAHGQVATANGGIHYYIKPRTRGNSVRTIPGIDYRGTRGYVIAPPSTLGQPGRTWSWVHQPSPHITNEAPHQ